MNLSSFSQISVTQRAPLYVIDDPAPRHPPLKHPTEPDSEHGWLPINHHGRELYALSAAFEELKHKRKTFALSQEWAWGLEAYDAQKQFIVELFAVVETSKALLRKFRNEIKDPELLKESDRVIKVLTEVLDSKQDWVRYRNKLGAHKELPVPNPRANEICFEGLSNSWNKRFSEADLDTIFTLCKIALSYCKEASLCSWVRFEAEPDLVELWVPCKEQPRGNLFMVLPKEALKALKEGRNSLYGKYAWTETTQFEFKSLHLYRYADEGAAPRVICQVVTLRRLYQIKAPA